MSNKFFGKLGHWAHVYGFVTGDFAGAFTAASTAHINRGLYDLLTPDIPPALKQGAQVFNVAAQQNQARLGDPMPVLYGKFRIYPDLLSQPWTYYDDNSDEYLCQLMCVTQGQARMLTFNIGDTPITAFANVQYKLYQPGETVDLFHNNVFTNSQVTDIKLTTVGLQIPKGNFDFDATAHTITSASAVFTDNLIQVGTQIKIVGSQHNDGTYIVGFISADFKQLTIDGVLTDESATRGPLYSTITDLTTATTYGPARFDFGANIHAVDQVTDGIDISTIVVGNLIQVSGSGYNDGTYTVTAVDAGAGNITTKESHVSESAATPLTSIIIQSSVVGPFYANPPNTDIDNFAVDIVFPNGLFSVNGDGALTNSSGTVSIEWRKAGDTVFTLAESATFTAAINSPQRYTKTYPIPAGTKGQIEVKVTRTSDTSNSTSTVNQSDWAGLKGYILPPESSGSDSPTFVSDGHYQYPDRTILAVKVKATGQLSNAMGKQFNGIFSRLIPTWDGSAWTAPQETSSISWIFADIVMNDSYGLGKPSSLLDMAALEALDATLKPRGDFFNGYFDTQSTTMDTLAQIAACGRAKPVFDGRTFTMIRDEPRALRSALFSDQNMVAGSFAANCNFIGGDSPRGVQVTYWDEQTFVQKTILCGEDVNTLSFTLTGCTSRQQAWNEGNFILNQNLYRTMSVNFNTEMDGFIPTLNDLITVQTQYVTWGQSARVLSVSGLELTLDQSLEWGSSAHVVRLRSSDGTPTDEIDVTRGSADNIVVLAELSSSFVFETDGTKERTQLVFGSVGQMPMDALVQSVSPSDEFHCAIQCVVDDARVYADPGIAPIEPGSVTSSMLLYNGQSQYDGSQNYDGVKN